MIDEKKIYNYIKSEINPYGKPFNGTVYEFGLKIMGYIESMEKVSEWIPCSERLPEESLNSVIGWDEYRKRCCFVQYYCGRWILGNDVDSVKITAWMPLPEPYTEQTKGSETT